MRCVLDFIDILHTSGTGMSHKEFKIVIQSADVLNLENQPDEGSFVQQTIKRPKI